MMNAEEENSERISIIITKKEGIKKM